MPSDERHKLSRDISTAKAHSMICTISGVDCSACGRSKGRINRSSGIDRIFLLGHVCPRMNE
jgi:hypothetical protein